MYITLGLYTEVFEKPFLDATEIYYTEESKQYISSLDARFHNSTIVEPPHCPYRD
jgi:hypothetical protein